MTTLYSVEYRYPHGQGSTGVFDTLEMALKVKPKIPVPMYITLIRCNNRRYSRQPLYRWHHERQQWREIPSLAAP